MARKTIVLTIARRLHFNCRSVERSDAELLPAAAHRAPKVAKLVANKAVNPLLCRPDRFAHVVLDAIHGDTVGEFRSATTGPPCSGRARPERRHARARRTPEER
jgi:hypothetical protein